MCCQFDSDLPYVDPSKDFLGRDYPEMLCYSFVLKSSLGLYSLPRATHGPMCLSSCEAQMGTEIPS